MGIVHQVNLEHLATVVMDDGSWIYPDSLVGTDSHTTMINGLGVVGWGVGGIEVEAVMLGQACRWFFPKSSACVLRVNSPRRPPQPTWCFASRNY